MGKVITQYQKPTCESQIGNNTPGRSLKLTDICIHCGDRGGSDFLLLGQSELMRHNKVRNKTCYPICITCLDGGKKTFTYPKKKTTENQKRREFMNKKSAAKVPREQRKELFVLLRIEFDLVIISIISTR